MKKLLFLLIAAGAIATSCKNSNKDISQVDTQVKMDMKTIYDFKVESLDGKEINFADYKGKKILIVNNRFRVWIYTTVQRLRNIIKRLRGQSGSRWFSGK